MENIRLDRIRILEEKINLKLVEGDFLNLPKLSEQLSDEVNGKLTIGKFTHVALSPNAHKIVITGIHITLFSLFFCVFFQKQLQTILQL